MTTINIDDLYINEILSIAGYPLLTLEDDDFEFSKEDIKTLVVIPVLRDYYRWFPIELQQEYSVGTSFSLDFPTPEVFNVVDVRLNNNITTGGGATGNPFVNATNFRQTYSTGYGRYGTPYDYGMINASYLK